jgi:epoxyqueuosine reductase
MISDPHSLAALAKSLALTLGFDLVGISRPQPSPPDRAAFYRNWLATGQHASMIYLQRNAEDRLDPAAKFPWAKSILSLALSYYQDVPSATPTPRYPDTPTLPPPPLSTTPTLRHPDTPILPPEGKVARYAWGRDYHKVFDHRLAQLEKSLRAHLPPELAAFKARTYSDTGPLLERELAARAGLGWIGKHTLLIHPKHGSFFLLGELLLSLDLAPDSPIADHCGTCTRCIQACPTAAITPYAVNAAKCISYHTLENRGEIPPEFHAPMAQAGFLIGCDICQDVCPFNRRPLPTREADFAPRPPAPTISLPLIQRRAEQDWDIATRGRATRRAKHPMWLRNAHILAETPGGSPGLDH